MINLEPSERAALLIADFYASVTDLPHAIARGALANMQQLASVARAAGVLVCYSATVFRPGHPEIDERNPVFSVRKASSQPASTDPLELIHADLAPTPTDVVIGKHRVSAFYATPLDMILRVHRVNTLVVAGYATRGVVLSTVRQGSDMDYRMIVAEDCCVERDTATHDFLVRHILPMQADVASAQEIAAAFAAMR